MRMWGEIAAEIMDDLQGKIDDLEKQLNAANMKKQTEKHFDVVIYEKATRKICAIIGKNMKGWDGNGSGRNTAELRVQTGRERINDMYECEIVAAGKYQNGDVLP